MKKVILVAVLAATLASEAYAGHGTIEETESAVTVEYFGDPGDDTTAAPSAVADVGSETAKPAPSAEPGTEPAPADRPGIRQRRKRPYAPAESKQ